jgi:hypothetical protein
LVSVIRADGSTSYQITLPSGVTVASGGTITIKGNNTAGVTIALFSGDTTDTGLITLTWPLTLARGEVIQLTSRSTGSWWVSRHQTLNVPSATTATTAGNVTGTVAIGNGGTGATTAATARTALGVAATDGTGATGTWPISVTGNANTATSAPLLTAGANFSTLASALPLAYPLGSTCVFVQGSDGWPSFGTVTTTRTYSGGGGTLQMYTPYSPTNGGGSMKVRFGNFDVSSGNSWTAWKTLLADDSPANITYNTPGNIMNLFNTSSSGVQIGMNGNGANPAKTLRVTGGNFEVVNNAYSAVIMSLTDAGVLSAPVITQTSDDRKKENWKPLTDAQLDALADMKLAGTFDWIDGTGPSVGGSAQEIQAIVPEAVLVSNDDARSLTVNYGGLNFAILQAMLRRERQKESV